MVCLGDQVLRRLQGRRRRSDGPRHRAHQQAMAVIPPGSERRVRFSAPCAHGAPAGWCAEAHPTGSAPAAPRPRLPQPSGSFSTHRLTFVAGAAWWVGNPPYGAARGGRSLPAATISGCVRTIRCRAGAVWTRRPVWTSKPWRQSASVSSRAVIVSAGQPARSRFMKARRPSGAGLPCGRAGAGSAMAARRAA